MKKIIFLSVCALFLRTAPVSAQSWQWARQNTGGYQLPYFYSVGVNNPQVAADAFGNLYMFGGYTSPSISFGIYTITNPGDANMFLVKYDSSGNVEWLRGIANNPGSENLANAVVTDQSGNVYITGYCNDSALSFGTFILHKTAIDSHLGMFLAKYDSSGNLIWAQTPGGNGTYPNTSLCVDNAGHIYVTGNSIDTVIFGSITLNNASIYLTKYDSLGHVLWAKNASGQLGSVAITTDNSANIIIIGSTIAGTVVGDTLNFGTLIIPIVGDSGYSHIFIAKYDSAGNVLWAKCAGGNNIDYVYAATTDIANCIYIGCNVSDSFVFDSALIIFGASLLKIDSENNLIWSRSSFPYVALSMTKDTANNIYATSYNHTFKYDTSGSIIWNQTGGNISSSITICKNSAYISGVYSGNSVSFGSNTLINPDSTNWNIDLAKLVIPGPDNVPGVSTAESNIFLFPNPTNGIFTIDLDLIFDVAEIKILDISGKIVGSRKNCEGRQQFDLSKYPCGEYIIDANSKENHYQSKIKVK